MARSRHYEYEKNGYWQYDPTSDFGRIQRQNAFLKALINQAETRYNPLTLNAFIGSVVQGVTIDSTFTRQRPHLARPPVPHLRLPVTGHGHTAHLRRLQLPVRLPGGRCSTCSSPRPSR